MSPTWLLLSLAIGAATGWAVRGRRESRRKDEPARLRENLRRREEIDEARIRFFGNIAHEMRTPLTVVIGQLDSAANEKQSALRARSLRIAARNARRLQRLADQALELTLLDAGTLEPRLVDVDAATFLQSLVLSFEELADRKGLLLEYLARPRSIPIRVDPEHLTTIVSNLVSNALKYTPPDGRVGVAVEVLEGQVGPVLRIVVSDTGPGIPHELRDEIFERFRRGPETTPGRPGGAGIGLALVRELARLYGGDVSVGGQPGRGARFLVVLPYAGEASTHGPEPLSTAWNRPEITEEILYRTTREMDSSPPVSGRPTVLLAEDDPDVREWLASELAEIATVLTAADGSAALELARESSPDVIVSDVRMPELDGLAMCRRLRADERTSHIPVLLLSVQSEVERRVEALDGGADDYLAKPVDARELRARVTRLMERRKALQGEYLERLSVRPREVEAVSVDQEFLDEVVETIEASLSDGDFSVPDLANAVALSTSQLTRKLRSLIGTTPAQLIRTIRLRNGAELLRANSGSVGRIAHSLGFSDQSHFTRCFKRQYGMTPSAYREEEAVPVDAPPGTETDA